MVSKKNNEKVTYEIDPYNRWERQRIALTVCKRIAFRKRINPIVGKRWEKIIKAVKKSAMK